MDFILRSWKKLNLSKHLQIMIMRWTNDKFLIGVTGVIFNQKDEILLFKHSYRRVEWSLPGGYLKASEHPKKGLAREILEESGLTVKIYKIISTYEDDNTARLDLSYFGEFEKGEFKSSSEVSEYGFFPINKLPPLIDDQYIQITEGFKRYSAVKHKPFIKKIIMFFAH